MCLCGDFAKRSEKVIFGIGSCINNHLANTLPDVSRIAGSDTTGDDSSTSAGKQKKPSQGTTGG
jgi:hypothetical protein